MGLRILHCIASVNPAGGGPIEGLKQVSGAYKRQGHDIEIVSLDDPSAPWVKDCPVKCHAMGPGRIGNYHYAPRLLPWLRTHAEQYDMVVVNGIWQYHAFACWRALHGGKVPYFVFTHGMMDPWFKREYPLKHLKKWAFWPWSEYRILRDAAGVFFTCEEERRQAKESFWLYQCHEVVVAYGTSNPPGKPAEQRALFLEKFPELAHTKNLLFLGRVHEKKGADLLFQAFARVKARRPADLQNVRMVMAGPADHEYGHAMQSLAKQLGVADQTVWTGMVQGDLKWGCFQAAHAFVLPSHQENFGIAVAEAMASKVPVLISNRVNIWREIEATNGGFVDADTVQGTENLIHRWLDTPEPVWQQMGIDAQLCFTEKFLIDKTASCVTQALARHKAGLGKHTAMQPTH